MQFFAITSALIIALTSTTFAQCEDTTGRFSGGQAGDIMFMITPKTGARQTVCQLLTQHKFESQEKRTQCAQQNDGTKWDVQLWNQSNDADTMSLDECKTAFKEADTWGSNHGGIAKWTDPKNSKRKYRLYVDPNRGYC